MKKKYSPILIAMILALIGTKVATSTVFVGSTPKIEKNFITKISSSFKKNIALLFDKKTQDNQARIKKLLEEGKTAASQTLAPGVRAANTEDGTYVHIDSQSISWKTYTFNVDGKKVTIQVPLDASAPTQKDAEAIAPYVNE